MRTRHVHTCRKLSFLIFLWLRYIGKALKLISLSNYRLSLKKVEWYWYAWWTCVWSYAKLRSENECFFVKARLANFCCVAVPLQIIFGVMSFLLGVCLQWDLSVIAKSEWKIVEAQRAFFPSDCRSCNLSIWFANI
jgi:hypothetical protein